ncbi:MAG TPA: efflux RND transporter periplasmic adaptor subunit [Opitutus sp.]|nr:efflux RND transporter periplasmic adaptor subunit [Opitutus sp.]
MHRHTLTPAAALPRRNGSARVLRVLWIVLCALCAPSLLAAKQLYTCGMHPQIIRDEPGNCPICGMALVPVRDNNAGQSRSAAATEAGADRAIHIDAATIQRMNLKTGVVTHGPVLREFRTVGTVAYDESGLRDVTTKYEGWIEKLFVDQTWTAVKAGDPLFEIYSPDLYNAELNYLVALRSERSAGVPPASVDHPNDRPANADNPLTRAALARLQLFDVPDNFIAGLARTGQAARTFIYRAPADGIVIEKMAIQGGMIKPGELIYRLADLSSVWVLAQIYEQDLAFVRPGQEATVRVTYGPEHVVTGRVQTLLPQVEEQTRTATARIILPNPDGYLRPGMFVDVRFAAKLADDAVLVPDLAVVRSGEHNTVFVARNDGSFIPREVRLGARSQGDLYEVLSGLAAGERVVTSGEFMLDSESQLRDAIQKMLASSEAGRVAVPAVASREGRVPNAPFPATSDLPDRRVGDNPSYPSVGMAEATLLPPAARAALESLARTTVDASESLGADDFGGYQKKLPAMRAALAAFLASDPLAAQGPLAKYRDALPDRADVTAARRDFAWFSTAVADLVRENHLQHAAGYHIFQCPMAPGIGTGRWLSRTAKIKNPFYGSAMLECGDEIN